MKRENDDLNDILYRPTAQKKRRQARLNEYFSKRFMNGAKQIVSGGLKFSKHADNPYKL